MEKEKEWLPRNAKRKPNELWKPATRGNRGAGPRGRETAEASQPPSASPSVTPPLVLAAPLSLTGRYAAQGRLAAAGLARVVEDIRSLGGVLVGEER
jgi:hypothetical protein